MSTSQAISAVSAAFLRRLLSAANAAVPNAKVRLGAPTAKLAEDAKPLVNLHLYRIEPNLARANDHLPHRGGSGQTRGPSQLALNLHYMVSFYGDHAAFEPDLIAGEVMLALEHEPELSKSTIEAAIGDNEEIEDSDLAAAVQRLRVTRHLMTLDDFSKVWSILYQVPYSLSLAYEVAHVVIETRDPAPMPVPVAQPGLWVSPVAGLRLDAAGGAPESPAPPVWGGVLHLRGAGLSRPGLELTVDGAVIDMALVQVTPDRLAVPLTAATFGAAGLAVGVHRIQAVCPPQPATQPDHLRARSNALAFALAPAVTDIEVDAPAGGAVATGKLTVTFAPGIRPDQAVRLLLDARDAGGPSQVVLPGRAPGDQPGPVEAQLDFGFVALPRRRYLVRADVDGLVSPVSIDRAEGSATWGQITGPEVVL
jgi:hypothetical protein